jgi:serine/threonine protein kinase
MIGQTVSHYKILEKLGGGGMGVVYRAEDTKLKRTVALKFLPPDLTRDEEAKRRFIHEAQAASALDHNNICNIHEIGETDDGQMFIAMACYEGETLKSRIAKGPLRIEEATDISVQIAQGLAEAHQHGIVHRDVKPANVLITKSGVVKIVDFGLAKLSGASKLTRTGSTLGTVAYMSPEQLQDADVDARADIFSLGVVLYEMLTGKTPFRGDHEAALMYSIINEQPAPLQQHIADVPSELIHIVGRALEKSPADRYKAMDDLLIDLKRLRRETSKVSMPTFKQITRSGFTAKHFILVVTSVLIMAALVIVFILPSSRKMPRLNPDAKLYSVPLPVSDVSYCALSPDGNWIAFGGPDERGKWDVYFMNSSGGEVRRVTHDSTDDGDVRVISRDGSSILFHCWRAGNSVVTVAPTLGGSSEVVCAGSSPRLAAGGERLFYLKGWVGARSESGEYELWSSQLDGTDNHFVFRDPGFAEAMQGQTTISYSPSPDGSAIAWIKTNRDFSQSIITIDLVTLEETQLSFGRGIMDEVFWTQNDFIIYSQYTRSSGNFDLWMGAPEDGEPLQLTRSSTADEIYGVLSEDGKRLLYRQVQYSGNVQVMNLETGGKTPVTSDDRNRSGVCVSPDNRFVAYTLVPSYLNLHAHWGIQVVDRKGELSPKNLVGQEKIGWSGKAWSPDGDWIAYTRVPDSVGGKYKICIVSPFGPGRSRVVAEAELGHRDDAYLWWPDERTLSWFAGGKTWVSSIENPNPQQFYQDSTRAYLIQDKKYLLFGDYRAGRQGWWIDSAPSSTKRGDGTAKRILEPVDVAIAPSGQFMLTLVSGELFKVSLPDGKRERLPCRIDGDRLWWTVRLSQDGKSLVLVESVSNSKLILWENPFIWE